MFAIIKPTLALLAAALLALGAAACGSGSTSSSTAGTSQANATPATTPAATTSTSTSTASGGAAAPGATAPRSRTSTAAQPARGEQSSASPPPARHSGGDESIQKFGHEGAPSDKAAVATAVKAYYAAVAADDGGASCALLSAGLQRSIVQSLGRAPSLRNKGCAGILALFFGHRAAARISPAVTVTGVRLKGDHGFALISTKTAPNGEIPVVREGDAWKIGALIGSSLP